MRDRRRYPRNRPHDHDVVRPPALKRALWRLAESNPTPEEYDHQKRDLMAIFLHHPTSRGVG